MGTQFSSVNSDAEDAVGAAHRLPPSLLLVQYPEREEILTLEAAWALLPSPDNTRQIMDLECSDLGTTVQVHRHRQQPGLHEMDHCGRPCRCLYGRAALRTLPTPINQSLYPPSSFDQAGCSTP